MAAEFFLERVNILLSTFRANLVKLTNFQTQLDELKTLLQNVYKLGDELDAKVGSISSRINGFSEQDDDHLDECLQVKLFWRNLLMFFDSFLCPLLNGL